MYYARLPADVGVAPADAVVVDNSPAALAWVAAVGAPGSNGAAATCRITSVAALPALLTQMEGTRADAAET